MATQKNFRADGFEPSGDGTVSTSGIRTYVPVVLGTDISIGNIEIFTGEGEGGTVVVTLSAPIFDEPYNGQVTISGVTTTTEINDTWYYESQSEDQLVLTQNYSGTQFVDGSAWSPYYPDPVTAVNANSVGNNVVSVYLSNYPNASQVRVGWNATVGVDTFGVVLVVNQSETGLVIITLDGGSIPQGTTVEFSDPNGGGGSATVNFIPNSGLTIQTPGTNITFTSAGGLYFANYNGLQPYDEGRGIQLVSGDYGQPAVIATTQGSSVEAHTGNILLKTWSGETGGKTWQIATNGILTMPAGGDIRDSTGNSVIGGGANTGNVTFAGATVQGETQLNLSASPTDTANLKYLQVRAGDTDSHIHFDTGNNAQYDLFVGDDYKYVQVNSTGNIIMSSYDSANGFQSIWTFDNTGAVIFPTLDVDLHNGGVQSAQTLQFGNPNYQSVITGPTPGTNENAQRLIIQGQRGNGTGEGGDVYFWAGDADTNGGDIKIYAGDADNVSAGSGGYVNISGGSGFDDGGDVSIDGGQSANGTGGLVSIAAGQGNSRGGNVQIQSGYGYAGPGGDIVLTGGGSANGLAEYGNIIVQAGVSTWTFDNLGNLTISGNIVASGSASPAPVLSGFDFNGGEITSNANIKVNTNTGNLVLGRATATGSPGLSSTSSVTFTSNREGTTKELVFTTAGDLSLPGNIGITGNISGGNLSVTGNVTGGNLVTTGNVVGNVGGYEIGYRDVPQIAASNTTIGLTDAGKHYYSATAGNFTLTIPNNTTTSFSTGTAVSIVVQAAGNILVNAASGVTLYLAGNSTAANRVVGAYGMATIMKVASDTWFINGTGVS